MNQKPTRGSDYDLVTSHFLSTIVTPENRLGDIYSRGLKDHTLSDLQVELNLLHLI